MAPHVSVSRWDVQRAPEPCEFGCGEVIGQGEQVRRVGVMSRPCCCACAKRRFDLEPPDHMPAPTIREVALGMTKTGPQLLPKDLPFDFKAAQSKDGE